MLNKIFIMGRLTRDPELRHTQSGTAVASFSLAVDRDFKEQDGNKRRRAEVIVNSIYFGDSKKDGDSSTGNYRAAGAPVDVSASDFTDVEDDGELPF